MMRRYTLQQLKVIIITLDGFGTELLSLILSTDKQVYHSRLTYYFFIFAERLQKVLPLLPVITILPLFLDPIC